MVTVKPFRGIRPAPEKADAVVSLPYDVLNAEEARNMAKDNPDSFLHVTRPEIDMDPDIDCYDERVYQRGKENLEKMLRNQVLIRDETPCFYVYKLRMGDHTQVGLVATVAVKDYQEKRVKIHEFTRADKEDDRTKHIRVLQAQAGPVFLMVQANNAIQNLIENAMQKAPLYDLQKDHDIQHTLYLIDDPGTIQKLEEEFAELKALYIADGHHRSAAASRVQQIMQAENPNHTGDESYNYFLSVIFPHDHLRILDYNRVVRDLNGMDKETFFQKISKDFDITPYIPAAGEERVYHPPESHTFGMYIEGQWYALKLKKNLFDCANPVECLDVWLLQENLLDPVLGIKDVRTDKRIQFIGGIRGLEWLEKLVDSGKFKIAFALYPTQIEELIAVADAESLTPPKSTWFEPKLGSGMIIHKIND